MKFPKTLGVFVGFDESEWKQGPLAGYAPITYGHGDLKPDGFVIIRRDRDDGVRYVAVQEVFASPDEAEAKCGSKPDYTCIPVFKLEGTPLLLGSLAEAIEWWGWM